MQTETGESPDHEATRFDALALPMEAAKRDMEATAWAVALAAPGLFAGLSNVDKLFGASRFPSVFGYVFGMMLVLLLLSIYIGIRNYTRLHGLISTYTTMVNGRLIREQYHRMIRSEAAKPQPDRNLLAEYSERIQSSFRENDNSFDLISTFMAPPGHKLSLTQRRLLEYAYVLFVAVLLTSDFARLLKD